MKGFTHKIERIAYFKPYDFILEVSIFQIGFIIVS